jgi:hypothetical protein
MATLTVASDHSAYLDKKTITSASQTALALTVTVDTVTRSFATGKYCYMEFIRADGRHYYKGLYDLSLGTFTCILGSVDRLLAYDGKIKMQLVIRDIAPPSSTCVWKSDMVEARVATPAGTVPTVYSINSATGEPDIYPAETVTIADPTNVLVQHQVEEELERLMVLANTL